MIQTGPLPRYEHFPHAADMGIRGYGRTQAEAFEAAALALTAVICPPERVGATQAVPLRCQGEDPELLLVDWLNGVIYEMAVGKLLFSRYEVALCPGGLTAMAHGEPVDPARHRPAVEVKGATYTALKVQREADGTWMAQCVVDV